MMSKSSEAPVGQLLEWFVKYRQLRMAAVRRLDIRAANRHVFLASAAAADLVATPQGRSAVEGLLSHPDIHLRVDAGMLIIDWAPEKVVPLFGQLLDADLSAIGSREERLEIKLDAAEWLYRHFGIRNGDRNALIEPLKAYGVALAYRDPAKWQ